MLRPSSGVWIPRAVVSLLALVSALGEAVAADSPSAPQITRRAGSDWPKFLGPTGDSCSTETGITVPWPAAGPPLVWQVEISGGYSAPSISAGRLFVFDRPLDRNRLRALESETGRPLWEFSYPTNYQDLYGYDGGPRCAPVVDGDRLYIFGPEGMLHCLVAATGKVVWKVDTTEKFGVVQNFFGVGSTPVVEGDLLIVQVGGSPAESRRVGPGQLDQVVGNGSGIVAFDKRDGTVKYQLTDELASYASPVLATIGDRRWGFVFARGGLVGFEPASGKLDFHFPWRAPILESVNASNPVVVGDRVFVSETYGPGSALVKVRPGGYDVVWSDAQRRRDKSLQTHWNTPIYRDGYLYGSSGRHEGNAELRCIELATGKILWSEPGLHRASLLYVDGHFVVLSEDGTLRLVKVNPEKFDLISTTVLTDGPAAPPQPPTIVEGVIIGPRRLLKPPAWAAPVLAHGLLYVRGRDRLVCAELIPPAGPAPR